ncbi:2', 3'-cyclic nucleotide 2'-phosphodiesterase [Thermosipho melanesiensis]|uniref:5'-Nucleotidase domain protein n=2 Tax=Thermosipho melanesiensis TaxID=46541 RepID=A6LMB0_THEM4|nr:5'-nucleotidase C-terminal domain-containing protein [Thermosipho melanesiensis]ABR31061.1 5'-Nucleotidase domain protein [Thermosipho melanesiensis BI429]APT74155.1 2', 3'-cyclic nucleotide 2'-phosphodiesterase [Thermosipho melanesiensis]OOC36101.1 2', 3'-cyclic nucleotide 2'-phosphodiesterase [Thermosipho melanesiensis]OOC36918.1 2', 3'-cyclic nucleotide 2'-phosphodiesterase [Thermosipho melanesiensis]OOC37669.1 2', 3'-cyclic nucleotide 2'-phosphodiesterase [Thermosipho melanesiensis]
MRKFVILFFSVFVILGFSLDLVILHTSDLHGNILPINYATNMPSDVGLAKIATLVKQMKKMYRNVILIDSGDLIQGTPLEYYHARIDNKPIDPMILVMNKLGYSAWTLGNHEFNYGLDILNKAISEAQFPALSANILNENGEPVFKPYHIVNVGDIKVGILGLTTKFIPNWEEPKNIKGLKFEDPIAIAKKYANELRNKVDVLVVSYHGGLERDPETGEPTEELTGENQGYQLLEEVDGIDVLLLGHQHRTIATKINGVPVSMPSYWGKYVGKVVLKLEKVDGKWKIVDSSVESVSVKGVEPDTEVMSLVKPYEGKVQTWLDQPVGYAKGDFWIYDPLFARLQDNSLIEFVNKVQMYYSKAKISSTALFNNSIRGWKKGPVTLRDINAVYIYPNTLKIIKVKGKDIKDALEKSADYFVYDNYKVSVNKSWVKPKPRHYNYDMWEGISYKIVLNNPSGERIVDLMFEGKPIEMDKEYEIVLNNYRAGGGGGYLMFKGKPVVREVMMEVSELMADYILNNKEIEATVDNNWETVIKFEYIVKPGDNLWSISKRLGISMNDLIRWNGIKNPSMLKVGQKLVYYKNYIDTLPPIKEVMGF